MDNQINMIININVFVYLYEFLFANVYGLVKLMQLYSGKPMSRLKFVSRSEKAYNNFRLIWWTFIYDICVNFFMNYCEVYQRTVSA